jgi:hypothetical protein
MREKVRGGATADEGFVDRGSVPQEKDAEAGKTTGVSSAWLRDRPSPRRGSRHRKGEPMTWKN